MTISLRIVNVGVAPACDECGKKALEWQFDTPGFGFVLHLCTGCLGKWRDTITEALNANP